MDEGDLAIKTGKVDKALTMYVGSAKSSGERVVRALRIPSSCVTGIATAREAVVRTRNPQHEDRAEVV